MYVLCSFDAIVVMFMSRHISQIRQVCWTGVHGEAIFLGEMMLEMESNIEYIMEVEQQSINSDR